jgi:hypothetical protein
MTITSAVPELPWQLWLSAAVTALLGGLLIWQAARRISRVARRIARRRRGDELFSQITMIVALGWSADAMWVIARDKAHLPLGVTIMLFAVFEAALLLSMSRAKKHLAVHGWPGTPGHTAWGIAGLMSLAAIVASDSAGEALVRMFIPFMVTKLWWDGLKSGRARKAGSVTSWRWTPHRLLLAIGAIEPGERDVETVHRERLTQTMTRLEYLRATGSRRFAARRGARLSRLSLKADDALIADVRQRVSRATWWTVTPLTQAPAQSLTQLGQNLTQLHQAAPVTQPTRVTKAVTSSDAADADPATRAAFLLRAGKAESFRDAARQVPGASEATVRRRMKKLTAADDDAAGAVVTQLASRVNGHRHDAGEVAVTQN